MSEVRRILNTTVLQDTCPIISSSLCADSYSYEYIRTPGILLCSLVVMSQSSSLHPSASNANVGETQSSPNPPQQIVAPSTTPQVTLTSPSASKEPTNVDHALSASTSTLTGLKAIAGISTVPGLSNAATIASEILERLTGCLSSPMQPQDVLT